jgi:hypothetical protein
LEEFPQAWQHVAERAKDGKVTSSLVETVIRELSPDATRRNPPAGKSKRNRRLETVRLGQILALIQEARRSMEKQDAEHALAALQNIEDLLFKAE